MKISNTKKNIFTICACLIVCALFSSQAQASAQYQEKDQTAILENISLSSPVLKESVTIIKNNNKILNSKYTIQPGDIISFSVYDEPDLNQADILVRPDGYATVRPIGEVYAVDYDIDSLTNVLKEKLSNYILSPQISLNIIKFHPSTVYIYGAVQIPGMYQQVTELTSDSVGSKDPSVKTSLNISNVISNAGGVTYYADLSKVEVTEGHTGNVRVVDLWKFLKEGDTLQNTVLRSGDKIYIPKKDIALLNDEDFELMAKSNLSPETFPVRVIGEVRRSGIFAVPSNSPFINSAIAMAEGYNFDANQRTLQILRKQENGKIAKIFVNPSKIDYVLRPNDTICVRQKIMSPPARFADYVARMVSPIFGISNAYNNWAEVFKPDRRYNRY